MNRRVLADLLEIDRPDAVRRELHRILGSMPARPDPGAVDRLLGNLMDLYAGRFPGYRACTTGYHDLRHAVDTLLAMTRLVHGGVLDSAAFSGREVLLALAAAAFHDSGYIQSEGERSGTGARFRKEHEARGAAFLARHAEALGLAAPEAEAAGRLVGCTEMAAGVSAVTLSEPRLELLGRMLAAADLLAQLSDAVYLEKLPLLYAEDRESGAPRYASEMDALRRAMGFHEAFKPHIARTLADHERLLRRHFKARWGVDENRYALAIERQHAYLGSVLADPAASPQAVLARLRRTGTAERTRRAFA